MWYEKISGDSGGPIFVQCSESNDVVLAGLVSWGKGCATAAYPGVYVRISHYHNWLNLELSALEGDSLVPNGSPVSAAAANIVTGGYDCCCSVEDSFPSDCMSVDSSTCSHIDCSVPACVDCDDHDCNAMGDWDTEDEIDHGDDKAMILEMLMKMIHPQREGSIAIID